MNHRRKRQRILTLTILGVIILNIIFLNLSVNKVISADYIAVRSDASSQVAVQELVNKGESVTVLKKEGEWTQIFIQNRVGWVLNNEIDSNNINASQTATPVKATNSRVSVFKDSRSTDKELGKLTENTTYLKYFEKNGWSQIVYNNTLVWVESNAIEDVKATEETSQVTTTNYPNYPAVTLASVTKESAVLVNSPQTLSTLASLLTGDEILLPNTVNTDGYYYGTSTSNSIEGYINAKDVVIKENVMQRTGTKSKTLKGATIVLDAGHGGDDGGAVDSTQKIKESDITLKTAETVKNVLANQGVNVIMTRNNDKTVELSDRSAIANQHNADVFISLHYDSSEATGPSGTTVHYLRYEDTRLADLMEKELSNLPLKSNGKKINNFLVLRESKSPAILLELGYMNNRSDVNIFNSNSYREQVAQSILKALQNYFN